MTPIEQVFNIFKDFFSADNKFVSDEYQQISPKLKYFKFASGQLNNFSVSVRPYREHHDLNIRWLLSCKSYKPCRMDLQVCENNFKDLFYYWFKRFFHSVAFSCSKLFRY